VTHSGASTNSDCDYASQSPRSSFSRHCVGSVPTIDDRDYISQRSPRQLWLPISTRHSCTASFKAPVTVATTPQLTNPHAVSFLTTTNRATTRYRLRSPHELSTAMANNNPGGSSYPISLLFLDPSALGSEQSLDEAPGQDANMGTQQLEDNLDPRLCEEKMGQFLASDVSETLAVDEDMILKHRRYDIERLQEISLNSIKPCSHTTLLRQPCTSRAIELASFMRTILFLRMQNNMRHQLHDLYRAEDLDENSIDFLKLVVQMYRTFLHHCLPPGGCYRRRLRSMYLRLIWALLRHATGRRHFSPRLCAQNDRGVQQRCGDDWSHRWFTTNTRPR
jgi:hypothetical protein